MLYVLRRTTDGKFVAKPGLTNSYTNNLANAQKFKTTQAAERDRCIENEVVVPVSKILAPMLR